MDTHHIFAHISPSIFQTIDLLTAPLRHFKLIFVGVQRLFPRTGLGLRARPESVPFTGLLKILVKDFLAYFVMTFSYAEYFPCVHFDYLIMY